MRFMVLVKANNDSEAGILGADAAVLPPLAQCAR